ncbi:hypothetical protein N9J72_01860, partial [Candidatus Gracilibacteria bacterium]|nr:hypothetical protein [Candidatus Gracilibacteria bacterium]
MSEKNIERNANHIDENSREIKNNTKLIHLLYIFIIILMMIIAGLAFYVGTMFGNTGSAGVVTAEDVTITIIDDARCTDCETDAIVNQIKTLPFLVGAEYIEQDFSDAGVAEYLEANSITLLPAVIFSTNILNDAGQIAPFLTALPNGEFSLAIQSTFNPNAERSERGFLKLDTAQT